MKYLRSLLVQLAIYGTTPLWAVALLPCFLLPRRFATWGLKLWGGSACWQIAMVGGITIEERGKHHLPKGQTCIVASKHQSALDTFALVNLVDDAAIVLKHELTWIPFFGWMLLKAGMIKVRRGDGRAALKSMLADAGRAKRERRPIVIFPEGTRTAPGERRPYRRGISLLYSQLDVPVVPVALNSGLFWPRRSFLKFPGRMVIEYLPPIPPGLPHRDFLARLTEAIETASERLADETRKLPRG